MIDMTLAKDDLLIVQRPATKVHYKIKVEDLAADTLPDGVNPGDYLAWTGSEWLPTDTIDGGVYAS